MNIYDFKSQVPVILVLLLVTILSIYTVATYSLKPTKTTSLNYYFTGYMDEPNIRRYMEFINKAPDNSVIMTMVTSPGGLVVHGIDLVAAVTEAKLRGVRFIFKVNTLAASMAAYLVCTGDKVIVAPHAIVMFHTIQNQGKPITTKTLLTALDPIFDAVLLNSVRDIAIKTCKINAVDVAAMFDDGKDIYYTREELYNKTGIKE